MSIKRNIVLAAIIAAFLSAFAAQAAEEKPATEATSAQKAAPAAMHKMKPHDHSLFNKASAPSPGKDARAASDKDEPAKADASKHVHSRDR